MLPPCALQLACNKKHFAHPEQIVVKKLFAALRETPRPGIGPFLHAPLLIRNLENRIDPITPPNAPSSSHQAILPHSSNILHKLFQLLIVIIPTASPPIHNNLLLLLLILLCDRAQNPLELLLADLLPDLAGAREHNEPVFYIGGARLFYETYAAEAIGCIGCEDLGKDRITLFGWWVGVSEYTGIGGGVVNACIGLWMK